MKNKGLLLSTLIFFLFVNTNYYWIGKLEIFAFPTLLVLALFFVILSILLIGQIIKGVKEKFSNKTRNVTIGIMTAVLFLTFLKPYGLINFDKLSGKDILVAQREGVANCMTTIKLKENKTFSERSVCFGVSDIKGNYELKNDTIFFENIEYGRNDEFYEFAVIKSSNNNKFSLIEYKNKNDTIGYELLVVKNELNKLNTKRKIVNKVNPSVK